MDAARQDVLGKVDGRYLFVDNTRFWCMFAVVALHCTRVFSLYGHQSFVVAATLFKFGTIGFFLVSGFLLERNLAGCDPWAILRKRLGKVFVPWVFWFLVTYGLFLLDDLVRRRGPFAHGFLLFGALGGELNRVMTATSLWFVPNLLFGLCVLLLLRRVVDRLWFGIALLVIDLFYVANIYGRWSTALHSEALFGFIVYLWLGHYAASHPQGFERLVMRFRLRVWGAAALLAAAASFADARWLAHLGSNDPLNTLRPTNQLFSVLVVLSLCRLRRAAWPRVIDVPRHMFGVYLSHSIVVALVLTTARHLLGSGWLAGATHSLTLRVGVWLLAVAVTAGCGWGIARWIAGSSSLCWLAGLASGPPASSTTPRETETPSTAPARPLGWQAR